MLKTLQSSQPLSIEPLSERIDLNQMLTGGSDSALLIQIEGAAPDVGIFDGDWVMIDKSKQPKENDIIITAQDGEHVFSRYKTNPRRGLYLVTDKPKESADKYEIFGVATFIIKSL